ncbi:MAG: 1-acyl-sn-glycerol-3-phosphate acyltransferase [Spirochaetes bacterium]|nr:1-acyl-sn-glycerol-3-phosphate acyltransferase [Spirochaetota bacterium]
MPYKHGRPVIDFSLPFRLARALTSFVVVPIAVFINLMQHSTRYKHRWRLYGIRRAVTVSNHTTVLDPAKIAGLVFPHLIFQTLLGATVEFPVLGTFIRLLGGVPIPRGKTSYRKLHEAGERAFKYRRFVHFYPEGECYFYSNKIAEFKTGAFKLAADLDIPVVPLVTVFSPAKAQGRKPFFCLSLPVETLVVLDPVPPAKYIRRDEKGEIQSESVKEFAEAVRQMMQSEIERRGGTGDFYRGRMERIKGLND